MEALAQHVKRLRAAGWHLYDAKERAALDGEALASSLAQEEAARKEVRGGGALGMPCMCTAVLLGAAGQPATSRLPAVPLQHLNRRRLPAWQDREAHDAALREVQQRLGGLEQAAAAKEQELGAQQAEVRGRGCCVVMVRAGQRQPRSSCSRSPA